ncbi:MAG: hypothetical protein ABIS36_12380 [Chryseolinea sp.]
MKPLIERDIVRISAKIKDFIINELRNEFGSNYQIVEELLVNQIQVKNLKELILMGHSFLNARKKKR